MVDRALNPAVVRPMEPLTMSSHRAFHRFGLELSIVVLAAFAALVAATVALPVLALGGPAGAGAGAVLGAAVGQAARRPSGALIRRLADAAG
jgi:hypothetical protein